MCRFSSGHKKDERSHKRQNKTFTHTHTHAHTHTHSNGLQGGPMRRIEVAPQSQIKEGSRKNDGAQGSSGIGPQRPNRPTYPP